MKTHGEAIAILTGKPPRSPKAKPELRFVAAERGDHHVVIPIKIVSEANAQNGTRGARMVQYGRKKKLRAAVGEALDGITPPSVPCVVRFVRIAPKQLDDDNLRRACKTPRDRVAQWLGIDDRDPRVFFAYGEERREAKTYGLRIEWWAREQHAVDQLRRASGQVVE